MVTYLIRRIVAAIVLLFVVSVITFSIFYLVPRLAGASPESLATRYVGRAAGWDTVSLEGDFASGSLIARYFAEGVHCATATLGRDRANLEDERMLEHRVLATAENDR